MTPITTTTPITSSDFASTTASLAVVPSDVVRTHILSRLNGLELAAASCASSHLNSLSTDDDLWRSISYSTWPSITNPLVSGVISTFPSGHRSFFSDAYPMLDCSPSSSSSTNLTSSLISAVDIFYKNEPILSRVLEMETVSGWFTFSPFMVNLLDEKETISTPILAAAASEKSHGNLDTCHMEENLTLSWILIDPTTKRAANVSSVSPVSVHRHWLTGEVQARYVTVVSREAACVAAEVTFGPGEGKEGQGRLEVREVSLRVEDMEGKCVSGRESVGMIAAVMSEGKRRKGRGREEGKRRYEEYEVMKRKCRERKQMKERLMDLVCITVGVSSFAAFWSFVLFR